MRKLIIFQLNNKNRNNLHIYNKDRETVTYLCSTYVSEGQASYRLFIDVNRDRLKAKLLMVPTL